MSVFIASDRAHRRAELLVNLLIVVLPLVGLVAALVHWWGVAFNWLHLAIMTAMYLATGLGITVGYHRLFTHKAFSTGPVMTLIIGILGSMAVEGPLIHWCAIHRKHHQHSDEEGDPHSPHTHDDNEGFRGMLRGLWNAHIGWIFRPDPAGLERYVPDLEKDPIVRFVDRTFALWALVGLLLPAAIAGLATSSWSGALLGLLWGGLVRIFVVHHLTWSINSVCHLWGSRPFESHDHSRNNPIFGILGLGEGWHNNHHAFPTSARHGLRWWQFDVGWLVIRALQTLRLIADVRTPTPERQAAKRRAA